MRSQNSFNSYNSLSYKNLRCQLLHHCICLGNNIILGHLFFFDNELIELYEFMLVSKLREDRAIGQNSFNSYNSLSYKNLRCQLLHHCICLGNNIILGHLFFFDNELIELYEFMLVSKLREDRAIGQNSFNSYNSLFEKRLVVMNGIYLQGSPQRCGRRSRPWRHRDVSCSIPLCVARPRRNRALSRDLGCRVSRHR